MTNLRGHPRVLGAARPRERPLRERLHGRHARHPRQRHARRRHDRREASTGWRRSSASSARCWRGTSTPTRRACRRSSCPTRRSWTSTSPGMKLPDDVTVVWPDDNFGYIRHLPDARGATACRRARRLLPPLLLGPAARLPLARIHRAGAVWQEMTKAYELGARQLWVVNVGDIKPTEAGTSSSCRWRGTPGAGGGRPARLLEAVGGARVRRRRGRRDRFGVWTSTTGPGFARKPEHLQWHLPGEPYRPSDFAHFDYGDEAQARIDAYDSLMARVSRLYPTIPPRRGARLLPARPLSRPLRRVRQPSRLRRGEGRALRRAGSRERGPLGEARARTPTG